MLSTLRGFTRTPLFWIIHCFVFIVSISLAIHYYPKAFPIIDLKIKMGREEALESAKNLAHQFHWGLRDTTQAISFEMDSSAQTFVELTAGGPQAFAQVLKEGLYFPYVWHVRNFTEGKTNEVHIEFSPEGQFCNFYEKVPESDPGKALSTSDAQKIAETQAKIEGKIDFSPFQLVEKSQEVRPNHRIDHTFVYERKDRTLGEGKYRLKLVVTGDRLTGLDHFLKIPETFYRHYSELRSSNNTIAFAGSLAMAILYLFCGCGLGIFYLARKRWILWKWPIVMGLILAAFQFFEQINQLPLKWMSYDTAISANVFLISQISNAFILFLSEFLILTVSFIAAESLSRKAFPEHPQLWRLWARENSSSFAILGRTLGGYLSVGVFFCFVVAIYILGTQVFGWWNPSDTLFHPDGLATYWPWFTSISNSVHAGFWEESLFRAIPLASAALLGNRFGHRKRWIAGALILQALIFGACHANYPTQPAYARVVELIIPSFMFGGIYLFFGLLPGIILHFSFDVIAFASPLFSAETPHIWIDRTLVILISLTPLWVCLIGRVREGRWTQLKSSERNGGWTPQKKEIAPHTAHPHPAPVSLNRNTILLVMGLATVCLGVWIFGFQFKNEALPLEIDRKGAITLAQKAIQDSGIHLGPSWEPLASISSKPSQEDQFIWKTEGKKKYEELMGNYLSPPSWEVRFVNFETSVEERAEEYDVSLGKKGTVFGISHQLPESRKMDSLLEKPAERVALKGIEKTYKIDPKRLKSVSSRALALPSRTDWIFIFSDPTVTLKEGEARILTKVSGDQAVYSKQFVFIPEEWKRNQKNHEQIFHIIRVISTLLLSSILLGGILYSVSQWTQKRFQTRTFIFSLGGFILLEILNFNNGFYAQYAQFSTTEPKLHQFLTAIGTGLVLLLFFSFSLAVCFGFLDWRAKNQKPFITAFGPGLGYGLGILFSTLLTGISYLFPTEFPAWGNLGALSDTIPSLTVLRSLETYIGFSLIFCFIAVFLEEFTHFWNRRKAWGIFILSALGLSFCGIKAESASEWLGGGLATGFALTLIYRYFFSYRLYLIPPFVFSLTALSEFKEIRLNAYPQAQIHGFLTLVCLGFISYLGYRALKKPDLEGHAPPS